MLAEFPAFAGMTVLLVGEVPALGGPGLRREAGLGHDGALVYQRFV